MQAATVGTVDSNTGAVALTNATAGEASDYTLTFVSNQNHEVGHYFVIKFPSSFSFFITHPSEEYKLTKYQWAEPKNSYIRCSSVTLDVDVECIVEHRMIKVFNGANVNAST